MTAREPDLNKNDTDCRISIDNLVQIAERELGAFVAAVSQLFGPEEAQVSGDDWIEELLSADQPMRPGITDWGRITINASRRLASRICQNAESRS